MKCFVCNRELTRMENGDLNCIPQKDHTSTFHLTSNKAGCGASYSYVGYKYQQTIEEFYNNKDIMFAEINKLFPGKIKPIGFNIKCV